MLDWSRGPVQPVDPIGRGPGDVRLVRVRRRPARASSRRPQRQRRHRRRSDARRRRCGRRRARGPGSPRSLSEPTPFSALAHNAGFARRGRRGPRRRRRRRGRSRPAAPRRLPPRRRHAAAARRCTCSRPLFPGDHTGVRAVGPDAPLRRAALIDVVDDGPWASHALVVHPTVMWALAGDASADPQLPLGAELTDLGRPGRGRRAWSPSPARTGSGGVQEAMRRTPAVAVSSSTPQPATDDEWAAAGPRGDDRRRRHRRRARRPAARRPGGGGSSGPRTSSWALDVARRAADRADARPPVGRPSRRGHRADRRGVDRRARRHPRAPTASPPPSCDSSSGPTPRAAATSTAAVRRLAGGHIDKLARRIRPTRGVGRHRRVARSHPAAARARRPLPPRRRGVRATGASPPRRRGARSRCSRGRRARARRSPPRSSPASSGSTCSSSTCRRSSASTSARPRRTSTRSSTPPGPATSCCSSTRPTRCSASARRSRTPATATPTSRSPTCLQRLEAYDGLVDAGDQLRAQHRRRVPAPDPRAGRVLAARRGRAQGDLGAQPAGRGAGRQPTSTWRSSPASSSSAAARSATPRCRPRSSPPRGDGSIDMDCLVRGVGREYQKLGRLLKPEDFGPYADRRRPLTAATGPPCGVASRRWRCRSSTGR